MKIITRGEAMRIHQQHPTSRLFPFCTGKYRWHGSAEAYTGREVQDIPGVLAVPPALRGGRAAAVALVAKQMARRGETVLPEALLPDYHRLSQAERERAERLAAEAAARNNDTENGKD